MTADVVIPSLIAVFGTVVVGLFVYVANRKGQGLGHIQSSYDQLQEDNTRLYGRIDFAERTANFYQWDSDYVRSWLNQQKNEGVYTGPMPNPRLNPPYRDEPHNP